MDLQELVTRGRFLFRGAPGRLEVFKYVNGKRNTKEIAGASGRGHISVLHDLRKMKDCGLIQEKLTEGKPVKKDNCIVYEKIPLLNHVSLSYFKDGSTVRQRSVSNRKIREKPARRCKTPMLTFPSEAELLDICRQGEGQLYEFKEPRVETEKITREISAFLNTKMGGLIFYGVADDGSIVGSDRKRQDFDQTIQNSIRNTISPQPNVEIKEINVLGQKVLAILVPAWDRKTVYQYSKDNRYYVRKGSNVFPLKPEEIYKLGKGEYIV